MADLLHKIKAHADNIALSHSVFALPFAYVGAILAAGGLPSWPLLGWITLAMVGARSAALALNNLIDLKWDRLHPRFTSRPMVTGAVTVGEAVILIIVAVGVFVYATLHLPPLCLKLLPLALAVLVIYPYMKRFSWTCHLVLGVAQAAAPIGAWIAVTGTIAVPAVVLGLAVGLWIAAFDIVYGAQDVAFDRAHGLHSIPTRFGVPRALVISAVMHVVSIGLFIAVGAMLTMSVVYYAGVALAAFVLTYQHLAVSAIDLSGVTQRYFMRNGLVGLFILLFTIIDMAVGIGHW